MNGNTGRIMELKAEIDRLEKRLVCVEEHLELVKDALLRHSAELESLAQSN